MSALTSKPSSRPAKKIAAKEIKPAVKKANFAVVRELDVPHSRKGKHHLIVAQILSDVDDLEPGMAIQVPLADLKDSKENVRSALNRALAKKKINAATASDATYFYIWRK